MQLGGKQKSEKGNTDDKFMIYDIMIYDIMIYDDKNELFKQNKIIRFKRNIFSTIQKSNIMSLPLRSKTKL